MIDAIAPIASSMVEGLKGSGMTPLAQVVPGRTPSISFEQMLRTGIAQTDAKVAQADRLVTAFAVDDSIPAHQVTFALEQARLSLELMIQIRNRMVEGLQQIMNMQV